MRDRICIVGAAGMLGRELVAACARAGLDDVHALDLPEIDITDAAATAGVIGGLRPALVINAAAFTNVDGCETQQDLAMAVNGRGPGNLAAACRACEARLVHVSSDYVFDGCKREPYLPDDPVNPMSVYGRSKAEGDRFVRETLPDHAIVRSSWLFAAGGSNFVKTILRLSRERDELRVVNDQVGRPTFARDLAEALLRLGRSRRTGTYHFCNAGACSWQEFAAEIVRQSGSRVPVRPMTTAELNRPAPRPAYSVLSTDSFTADTGLSPRPWPEALAECLAQLDVRVGELIP